MQYGPTGLLLFCDQIMPFTNYWFDRADLLAADPDPRTGWATVRSAAAGGQRWRTGELAELGGKGERACSNLPLPANGRRTLPGGGYSLLRERERLLRVGALVLVQYRTMVD